MSKNYYVNKANYLLEKLSEEEQNKQLITVDMWSWDFNRGPYTLYTITDGKGNYPLTNDDSVFFTEYEDTALQLDIDGKPSSKDKELFVFEKDGKIGLYNGNFEMIEGPFNNDREASEAIQELISSRKIQIKNNEPFNQDEIYAR